MFAFLEAFFTQYGYAAVFMVLLACSCGVPIPEDITLVAGGVICGLGSLNVHLMVATGMAGVLIGDSLMYLAGHHFGYRLLQFKPIARILTPERYSQVQEKFDKYGNWVLFVARFLPGLRTPIFITAGISRNISYMRFVVMDGLAALISVPLWVYLGAYGAENRDWLMRKVHQFQTTFIVLGLCLAAFVLWWWWKKRKRSQFYRVQIAQIRARRKTAAADKPKS